jgi:hypothetical protein
MMLSSGKADGKLGNTSVLIASLPAAATTRTPALRARRKASNSAWLKP